MTSRRLRSSSRFRRGRTPVSDAAARNSRHAGGGHGAVRLRAGSDADLGGARGPGGGAEPHGADRGARDAAVPGEQGNVAN